MISSTVYSDLRMRYAGTTIGLVWIFISPLLFLGLYSIVYTQIFKIKPADMSSESYVLVIFSGLVPFLSFAEAIGGGVPSVVGNKSLIRNTLFPIEFVPLKVVLVASAPMLVGFSILITSTALYEGLRPGFIMILPIMILQLVFTIGLVWLLAPINVFVRDVGNLVPLVILVLMLISPIAYLESQVPAGVAPILHVNPLAYLISLYRQALFGEIEIGRLVFFAVFSFAVFVGGYIVFTRLKVAFLDYV